MNENLFIHAARVGKNDFWRYLVSLLLVGALAVLGGACPAVGLLGVGLDLVSLSPPLYLALNLVPFFFVLGGLAIALPRIHHRPLRTLINPLRRFSWRAFFLSAGLWGLVSAAGDLVLSRLQPGNYVFSFDPARYLPWLAAVVFLLPFQCAAEELFFRGYLTQGLGLAGGFWLAWLLPSFLFGLLHGANPEVLSYGALLTLPVYIGTGLLLGWVTLRSGGLEMALGLHIANNLYSTLLVTFPSSALASPALFKIQRYDALAVLLVFFAAALCYLGLLGWFGRHVFSA